MGTARDEAEKGSHACKGRMGNTGPERILRDLASRKQAGRKLGIMNTEGVFFYRETELCQ